MIAAAILILLGVYLAGGLFFAIFFALTGAGRIDPHALRGSRGFRVLIIPGAMALWPLLLRRWMSGRREPPDESNAHRSASQNGEAP